ncbi:hypothetical protein [Dactylosporangium sp. NPDC005555]|uniref:hypothetical protein n=1 Tax=Dactylosporangium sp. NPDC005555 TaxID=3154889 RepID=UPI0033B02792
MAVVVAFCHPEPLGVSRYSVPAPLRTAQTTDADSYDRPLRFSPKALPASASASATVDPPGHAPGAGGGHAFAAPFVAALVPTNAPVPFGQLPFGQRPYVLPAWPDQE